MPKALGPRDPAEANPVLWVKGLKGLGFQGLRVLGLGVQGFKGFGCNQGLATVKSRFERLRVCGLRV